MTIKVLIPVHKESVDYLRRCLNSVLMQPVEGVEAYVLLSGAQPAPGARDYLEGLAAEHPQVHLTVQQDRLSASAARNRLIALSEGGTIAFLDADDEWLPNHLTQFQGAMADRGIGPDKSALYTAPYVQRQSKRRVHPRGENHTIWSLTRQPLLLSSMIMTHIPGDLRFREGGAEDLVFYADCLQALDHFVAGPHESVIYDQGNWAQKTTSWKLKRTYRTYMTIFENPVTAAFFVGLFSVHYLGRRAFGWL